MTGWAWVLPRDPGSPARARQITNEALATWGADPESDAAYQLLVAVSEAVTNGVTHGTGEVTMSLDHIGGLVTCEITSHGRWITATADAGPDSEHGRGLALIGDFAEITRFERGEAGTVIAFRVLVPVLTAAGLAA